MPSRTSLRALVLRIAGVLFGVASVYSLMGVLQAMSLFTGERALRNGNLWGSLCLLGAVLAIHLFLIARSKPPARSQRKAVVFAVGWLAVAALALWPVLSHLVAVDRCLDSGASFNYVRGSCDTSSTHESLSLVATHGFLLFTVALAIAHAVASAWHVRTESSTTKNAP